MALRIKCLRFPSHYWTYHRHKLENPPVFIVGCGHSGTSLLLAVLGSHSRICAIPEETRIAYDYIANAPVVSAKAARLIRYFDLLAISENKSRWIEKTPKHIYSIPLLRKLFPGCKFMIILRDGRDVACSIEARYGSIEEGINRWIEDNRAGEPFWKDADVHVLKYEEIIGDFGETITKALHFMGEDFEEQLLRSHEKPKYYYSKKIEKPPDASQAHHDQYRNWQINQKLFDGRGKWRRLSDEKKAVIKKAAGDMLVEYGYAADGNW
ncbi:MAG TPA: sulfotransferase [Candidatus Methylacidiphilales bacterium]|nr:sulfotransferase [Candidatus Methylacidiphilales bacterium]